MSTGTGERAGAGMRVMVVTDQYEPMVGGVPTVTRELARGLAERGHAVALVVPGPGWRGGPGAPGGPGGPGAPGAPGGRGGDERVRITYRGSVRWPWYEGMRLGWLPAAAARTLIASFAPDVAHIHSPVTLGVMARIAARRQRVPVVYTNHYLPANVRPAAVSGPPGVLDGVFYRHVVGFANRCAHVTAPTATALRLLRERGLRVPSRVISNGVDLRAYSPGPADERLRQRYALPPGRPLIVSVGRLSPEKRMDVLLGAAARLEGALLAIAGAGPDEARLRALARRLGVADRVRFLGFVPGSDLPGLYRLADVFATASEAELQGLAVMEAMAAGLPVVAVDACALGELVRHADNGFLAAPGQAAELAAYLSLLCREPALRSRMSAASLRIISAHDRRHWLAEWESLYRALAPAGTGER
jgi:glycosyltransferase involved in cell wall biosynthesis